MHETKAIVKKLLRWYEAAGRDLPWRQSSDAYGIWICEIMLQQTQVKTVIPFWKRWMRRLPDIPTLARARETTVLKLWEGLGYYSRAHNIRKAAKRIIDQHDGKFPSSFEDILAIPGVGDYTAAAIASIAFGQLHPALDGNAVRVLARWNGLRSCTKLQSTRRLLRERAQSWMQIAKSISPPNQNACGDFNQSLMELGARVCLPRNPACSQCPIRSNCQGYHENILHLVPNVGARPKMIARRFIALVLFCQDKFLVRQRASNEVNGRLWEFPNHELIDHDHNHDFDHNLDRNFNFDFNRNFDFNLDFKAVEWMRTLGIDFSDLRLLGQIKHSIMQNRITMQVMRGEGFSNHANGQWLGLQELDKMPFAAAHRKIVERFLKSDFKRNARKIIRTQ